MTGLKTTIHHESGRIDKVLTNLFTDYNRSQIQLWLESGAASVGGRPVKTSYKVKQGDEITVLTPEPETLGVVPENIPLTIVYEDEDVVMINKPQGMVVHPSASHAYGTMVNALVCHIRDLSTINGVVRLGTVHRIGRDTSGLLMIAKSDQARKLLAQQLKDKASLCEYVTLVHGEIPYEKGAINAPISRSEEGQKIQAIRGDGKSAVIHFTVLERFEGFTLVKLKLEAGRTRRIRMHMKYIGCPLAGDPVYGPKKTLKGNGQFLHAQMLGPTRPTINKKMIFEVPFPEILEKTPERLRKGITF